MNRPRPRRPVHFWVFGLALVSVLCAGPSEARSFGRLFTTTEERALLDEIRTAHDYGAPVVAASPVAPVIPEVTINGVVVRSSGNNASWINGAGIMGAETTREGIRVEARRAGGGTVRIILPSSLDPFELKPGQKIDVVRGQVQDGYGTVGNGDADTQDAIEDAGGLHGFPSR